MHNSYDYATLCAYSYALLKFLHTWVVFALGVVSVSAPGVASVSALRVMPVSTLGGWECGQKLDSLKPRMQTKQAVSAECFQGFTSEN